MRCGVSMSAASAGSSRTTRSTMPPIGSSTRGIQSSSSSGTGEVWPFSRASILRRMAVPADLLLERLAAEPGEAGLFLDFDGVLAPIVERPEDAAPPPETRAELERLAGRGGLVGGGGRRALRAGGGRGRPGRRGRASPRRRGGRRLRRLARARARAAGRPLAAGTRR